MAVSPDASNREPEASGRAASFWQAFWGAVTEPSLGALCAIVALAGLQFTAILLWLTPDRIAATELGLWMNDPWDHSAYVTVETLRMQRSDPTQLGVVVVGSSAMRHVFEDHRAFPDRLSDELGEPIRMHFLAAGGQTMWESALVLDHLPEGFRGSVVIGMHPGRAIYDETSLADWIEHPRLGLASASTRALRQQLSLPQPEPSGFYFLDHMGFLAARRTAIARNLLVGPRRYERHGRHIAAPLSANAQQSLDSGGANVMQHWEHDGARGAQALQQVIEKLTTSGIQVLVAFAPLHPNVKALHPEALARFRKMIRESALNGGASVVDLNARAALGEPHFRDIFHLNAAGGRARCEEVLASELSASLRTARERSASSPERGSS